jgi:hypothetical protein
MGRSGKEADVAVDMTSPRLNGRLQIIADMQLPVDGRPVPKLDSAASFVPATNRQIAACALLET